MLVIIRATDMILFIICDMYIIIGLGIIMFVVVSLLVTKHRPQTYGVYSQPSPLYRLKRAIIFRVLNSRKRQNSKKDDIRGQTAGYGIRSRNNQTDMDKPQRMSELHPKAVDAVYFNGSNSDGYYFVAATARRHNGLIQTFLYVQIPSLGLLEMPSLPDISLYSDKQMAYSAGGLEISVVEPMKIWSLKFSGLLRLCRPDGSTSMVDVKLDLQWAATTAVFDLDTDIDSDAMADAIALEPWTRKFFTNLKEAHQTHYEQFGRLTGNINTNSTSYTLTLHGVRDHSYGNIRDWSDLHRYAIQYVVLEDGTSFCVGNICMKPTLTRLIIGYVFYPDGSMRSVSWTDLDLHQIAEDGQDPDDMSFSFAAGPDIFRVQCHVERRVIFYMGENWEGRIHERMCTFVVNGKKGWGFSEWDYCNTGGKNHVFKR